MTRWQHLAAAVGVRPRTLVVLVVLALLFIYLQEIHDSMEGFIDGYNNAFK
jgi:hypothetical protein